MVAEVLNPETQEPICRQAALQELAKRAAYKSFASFFRMWSPKPNYLYGKHTRLMINRLDKVVKDLEKGKCTYLILNIPFRHGKSDVVSRRWPAWSLLRNPAAEIILASYNYQIASEMSNDCRACFKRAGPLWGRFISKTQDQIGAWKTIEGGAVFATGFGGTVSGRGADILDIDDYYKNREEAESKTVRNHKWESFESDLLTRLAPKHAVVITANRWHVDDMVGRIKNKNNPKHDDYDPDFPVFEEITCPAIDEDGSYLFPERLSPAWYKALKAFLGEYAWPAQGLQKPKPRTGAMLAIENVKIIRDMPEDLPWRRGWDLASTEKQVAKNNPDFTVGTKACYHDGKLFVADVKRGRMRALKRNATIIETAKNDGPSVPVIIEAIAGYTDAYTTVRDLLNPFDIVVQKETWSGAGDKVARACHIEPLFDLGEVYIQEAEWNATWLEEFGTFPGCDFDDEVDSLLVAVYKQVKRRGVMGIER